MVDIAEYLALRERPDITPAMYQQWRDLTFLHFSTEPQEIQAMLPAGLTVDTFPNAEGAERAWVGLVPFRMQGVRPALMPAVPGCHAFPETNVRTYVHRGGKTPGVWFFSLDAANRTACAVARRFFSLPYFHADMTVSHDGYLREYESARRAKATSEPASLGMKVKIGASLGLAKPGTLEFFLVERYVLYAQRGGRLFTGQVNHVPYPIRKAEILEATQNLITAAGIRERPWEHVLFSPGVDVEVFGIKPAD